MEEFDYAEVVIHTCTGDTNVVAIDDGNLDDSRRHAEQVASIVRLISRAGLDMRGFNTSDWFKSLPDWAHITFVCVADRNSRSGDTMPYLMNSFRCSHTTVQEEASA